MDESAADGAASVADVLAELQGAFSAADTELEHAVARVAGMGERSEPIAAAAPTDTSESAEWSRVSRLLQHAGFAPLALERSVDASGVPSFSPAPDAMRGVLTQVLSAYERQQASLQSALEESATSARQVQSATAQKQVGASDELKRANAALEAQLEVARGRLREQTEETESAATAAEQSLGGLRQKLSMQTHQLKAREGEVARLQERLSKELGERDESQRLRERQVFQEVHRRAARPSSAADTRGLELIRVYDAQRRNMQAEIDDLRAASATMAADLKEKENIIARKDAYRSWRTPDEGELLGRLQASQRAELEAIETGKAAEAKTAEQLRAARLAASEARREAEVERARASALELDLSARPTVKQYTDARATIEQLRRALPASPHESALRRSGGADGKSQPAADSADAIRRDREVYELGLTAVQALPPASTVTLLQDSCRELQLSDAALLPAAIRKMCRALAALPPMETFVRDVCALALQRPGSSAAAKPGSVPSTKLVLQTLRTWAVELRDLQQLLDFAAMLSDLLGKRAIPGGATREPQRGKTGEIEVATTMPLRDIAHAVEELVGQERKALRALDSFERADAYVEQQMRLDPSDLLSKLCAHFCRLFELKSVEGMMPKMNELYLFINEQANLLRVLKSMVGLTADASVHSLLSAMRQALDLSADPNRPTPTAAPAAATADANNEKSSMANAAAAADGAGPKTLPQYVAIAAELRKLVHAPSVLAVVPAVKELQQQLFTYKQSMGQMQVLIQQLCATLSIGSAEALIAERMQHALAAAPSAAESK